MSGPIQVSLEDYTRFTECTTNKNGGWTKEQVELSALLRIAKATESIQEEMAGTNNLLESSNWCAFRGAVQHMAYKGITVRHEHSLTLKLNWSIRWPWQQRARRCTWRLFKRKKR